MARDVFENYDLPEHGIPWEYPRYIYEIFLKMPVTNRLEFEKTPISGTAAEEDDRGIIPPAPKTERLNLPIEEDCIIEFRLRQDLKWRWNEKQGIGRGNENTEEYFDLRYYDSEQRLWVKPTDGKKYYRAQFSARRRGGTTTIKDPINLNVLLEYENGEVLAVTLDPDIQNPKT